MTPDIQPGGPTWYLVSVVAGGIIMFLLGIVISLIAGYAKGLGTRVDKLESSYKTLNDLVLSQYLNKNETNTLLNEVKDLVKSLQGRFDMLLMQQSNQSHNPNS